MRTRTTITAGLVLFTLGAGCGEAPKQRAGAFGRAPIVLVSVDTLRADRLPLYGYGGVDTPNLLALRKDAVLFENAYTHCPLTLPSHVSLLTGTLPSAHGVRDNVGYRYDAARQPSLASSLRGLGYATGAAVSAYVLRGATGLSAGFDFYDEVAAAPSRALGSGEAQRPGQETATRARSWLAGVGARPFFLFLHLYEPHAPYAPPEPFRSRYGASYDGEIAAADAVLGEVIAALKRDARYDASIVVFVSDHGEGLGEHGEDEHGILLYRGVLRVPLLVKLPGAELAGATIREPVGLFDVAPTLLSLVGAEIPAGVTGRALLGDAVPAARGIAAETYYPRLHLGWSELRSLVDDRFHLIDGPRPELYDVVGDPNEARDLASARPSTLAAMRRALPATSLAAPAAVGAEERERMAALGYLSGGSLVDAPAAGLPNPRDVIHLRRDAQQAFSLAASGRDAEAVAALRALLAKAPGLFDARAELAAALARLGRGLEAEEAYLAAMRTSPALMAPLAVSLGRLRLERGDLAAAEKDAQLALAAEPSQAHALLAAVALARSDLERATAEAERADPASNPTAAVVLAEVRSRRGDHQAAVSLLDAMRQKFRTPIPSLEFVRGDALARLSRYEEADAALRAEIAAFPRNARAYASLAILTAVRGGERREIDAILARMERASPGRETNALAQKTRVFLDERVGADPALRR